MLNAQLFVEKLDKVYEKMLSDDIATTKGDEFLLSIAASYLKDSVKKCWCIYL